MTVAPRWRDEHLEEYLPDRQQPVATFWRQATPGTAYWRLMVPARKLPARVNALLTTDLPDPLARQQGDTAVWQFLGDLARTKVAAQIQSAGFRTMMELDDDYLHPPPHIPGAVKAWETTIRRSWAAGATGYSYQAHRKILPSLDGLIVSTDTLANLYEPFVPAGVHVCPNSVDPDDWPQVAERDRPVTVGYAGSDSHLHDLALVDRAVGWCASRGVPLVKIGVKTRAWHVPHETVAWLDGVADYRVALQKLDIGLCPLKRSTWHDCKSDVKAMEYLMAGVLPIVQADSPVYRDWVGLVPSAATPKQWLKTVRAVVEMPADERVSMWKHAHAWLLEHKTIDANVHKWRRAIGATGGGRHVSPAARPHVAAAA